MIDYTALYLPALPTGSPNPTKTGFETKDVAWEYVFSRMCSSCKEERERVLKSEATDECGSNAPACSAEWLVLTTSDLETCEGWDDLMNAVGAELIYKRPE